MQPATVAFAEASVAVDNARQKHQQIFFICSQNPFFKSLVTFKQILCWRFLVAIVCHCSACKSVSSDSRGICPFLLVHGSSKQIPEMPQNCFNKLFFFRSGFLYKCYVPVPFCQLNTPVSKQCAHQICFFQIVFACIGNNW